MEGLTREQLDCFISAVETGALLLAIKGEPYAARPYWGLGWWIWKLTYSSEVYFVDAQLARCTCPAASSGAACKHIEGLRKGSDWQKPKPKAERRSTYKQ